MRIFTHRNLGNWDESIPYVEMYLNSAPSMSLNISPYRMLYGRNMNLPLDVLCSDKVPQI